MNPYPLDRIMDSRAARRLTRAVIFAAMPGLLAILAWAAHEQGWRLNLTASEPIGLYRIVPYQPGMTITRGQRVRFCPPAWVTPTVYPFYLRGACPAGGMPMLKTVAGVPGDHIQETDEGIWINGIPLPASRPKLRAITAGIALPRWRGVMQLAPGQYWIIGSGENAQSAAASFDSRYWGPITDRDITGVANNEAAIANVLDEYLLYREGGL